MWYVQCPQIFEPLVPRGWKAVEHLGGEAQLDEVGDCEDRSECYRDGFFLVAPCNKQQPYAPSLGDQECSAAMLSSP